MKHKFGLRSLKRKEKKKYPLVVQQSYLPMVLGENKFHKYARKQYWLQKRKHLYGRMARAERNFNRQPFKAIDIPTTDAGNVKSLLWFGLFLIAFFMVVLGHNTNPMTIAFGDGQGNGGVLDIIADYGHDFSKFMLDSVAEFRSWGLVGNTNGFLNFLGSILTVIVFVVNVFLQTLILFIRVVIYIISGGEVTF